METQVYSATSLIGIILENDGKVQTKLMPHAGRISETYSTFAGTETETALCFLCQAYLYSMASL